MRTVVVVDDHPGFRGQMCRLLALAGYRVAGEAADGAAAMLIASAVQPDVMVLDVQLPDISGFEVASRLLAGQSSSVEVVLVSSRDATTYGGLIKACGAKGFIWKGHLSADSLAALVGEP
jgi:two-component system response regulator EvgA